MSIIDNIEYIVEKYEITEINMYINIITVEEVAGCYEYGEYSILEYCPKLKDMESKDIDPIKYMLDKTSSITSDQHDLNNSAWQVAVSDGYMKIQLYLIEQSHNKHLVSGKLQQYLASILYADIRKVDFDFITVLSIGDSQIVGYQVKKSTHIRNGLKFPIQEIKAEREAYSIIEGLIAKVVQYSKDEIF